MYSVGMEFRKHLVFKTPTGFWTKLDGIYCPSCGKADKTYGLCDAENRLHDQMICIACGFISNLASGFNADEGPYALIVEELRDHVKEEEQ